MNRSVSMLLAALAVASCGGGESKYAVTGTLGIPSSTVMGANLIFAAAAMNGSPELAGTEFGVFFSIDGGQRWPQLKGGMPVAQARDMAVQKRENDLVVATFGRGF